MLQSYSTSRDLSLIGTPGIGSAENLSRVEELDKGSVAGVVRTLAVNQPADVPLAASDQALQDPAEAHQHPSQVAQAGSPSSQQQVYIPPYQPRVRPDGKASNQNPPPSLPDSTSSENFAVTLHASLSRHSRDGPLPYRAPHLELHLAWVEPERFAWVPGRRLLPEWSLRYGGGDPGQQAVVSTSEVESGG